MAGSSLCQALTCSIAFISCCHWQGRCSGHSHFTTAGVCWELSQRQETNQPGSLPRLVDARVTEGIRVGQAGAGWGQGSLVPSSLLPGTEGVSGTAWRRHVT